jgi:hypothetical protein
MARTRRNRTRTRSRSSKNKNKNKNFIKRTLKTGMNIATTTSKKYMPRLKTRIEGVGSKVTKTATNTIPILQKTARNIFSMMKIKKSKR